MSTVVALFVAKKGCYFGLDGVDPWDEARDARLYAGPYPAVAHPPCTRWCQLAHVVQARYGYRVGEDGGVTFPFGGAVEKGYVTLDEIAAAFRKGLEE